MSADSQAEELQILDLVPILEIRGLFRQTTPQLRPAVTTPPLTLILVHLVVVHMKIPRALRTETLPADHMVALIQVNARDVSSPTQDQAVPGFQNGTDLIFKLA